MSSAFGDTVFGTVRLTEHVVMKVDSSKTQVHRPWNAVLLYINFENCSVAR